MFVLKGIAVGMLLLFVGAILTLCFSLFYGRVETNHATGLSALLGATLWNPMFWLIIILAMAAGIALVRFRVIK
jgi:hypothetical protein